MAETIRGINIVIGSDTTALTAALSDVNKQSQSAARELKQVERLLKMDPGNTELIAQKQQLLGNQVEATAEKLSRLRGAMLQVEEQFREGKINDSQYRAFQRTVIQTENELQALEGRLNSAAPEIRELGNEAEKSASKLKTMGDDAENLGKKLSVGLTAPLVGLAALATAGTEETRRFMARLEQNARTSGESLQVVEQAMRNLSAVSTETDSNVEAVSNILATGFRGEQFLQVMDQLTGAAIKFTDTLKIEGLADGLQETLATGSAIGPFAELLERSGVALDSFNAGLQAANKNGTEQQYILQQLSSLGLAEVNEQYRQANEELVKNQQAQYEFQQALAELGETLLPIVTAITGFLTGILDFFNSLSPEVQGLIVALGTIAVAVGPLLVIVAQVTTAITTLISSAGGITAIGAFFSTLLGPVGLVIAGVVALAAAVFLVIKNWEEIVKFFANIWRTVSDGIRDFITDVIDWFKALPERALNLGKDIVRGIWDGIKEMGQWLKDKVTGFGASVLGWFKDIFDINSPSGVMRDEIGKNLGLGVGIGLDDTRNNTLQAARRMRDTVMGGMSGMGGGFSGGGGMALEAEAGGAMQQVIHVTVSANDLQQMSDVVQLFQNFRQVSRARG